MDCPFVDRIHAATVDGNSCPPLADTVEKRPARRSRSLVVNVVVVVDIDWMRHTAAVVVVDLDSSPFVPSL